MPPRVGRGGASDDAVVDDVGIAQMRALISPGGDDGDAGGAPARRERLGSVGSDGASSGSSYSILEADGDERKTSEPPPPELEFGLRETRSFERLVDARDAPPRGAGGAGGGADADATPARTPPRSSMYTSFADEVGSLRTRSETRD